MQKLLFRGKDKYGQWHFGNGINVIDEADYAEIVFASRGLNSNGFEQISYEQHEVIPETVGQYIGIKDIKGHKIFEGDIIQFKNKKYVIRYFPEYTKFAASSFDSVFTIFDYHKSVVIGNIKDNTDLAGN